MKFSIKAETLKYHLNVASKAIDFQAIHPVLSCLLIESRATGITLSATDLNLTVVSRCYEIEHRQDSVEGIVVANARILMDLIARVEPSAIITLHATERRQLVLSAGDFNAKLDIRFGKDDFPEIVEVEKFTSFALSRNKVSTLYKKTKHLVSPEADGRPLLTAVRLHSDGSQIVAWATDGFKMCRYKFPMESENEKSFDINIPHKLLALISGTKVLATPTDDTPYSRFINISFGDARVEFKSHETEIASHLQLGNYPNLESILAGFATPKAKAFLRTDAVVTALQRAKVVAMASRNFEIQIKLEDDCFKIFCNSDNGFFHESIAASNFTGSPATICLSCAFLIDCIVAIDEPEFELELFGDNQGIIVAARDGNYQQLIMPVKFKSHEYPPVEVVKVPALDLSAPPDGKDYFQDLINAGLAGKAWKEALANATAIVLEVAIAQVEKTPKGNKSRLDALKRQLDRAA